MTNTINTAASSMQMVGGAMGAFFGYGRRERERERESERESEREREQRAESREKREKGRERDY